MRSIAGPLCGCFLIPAFGGCGFDWSLPSAEGGQGAAAAAGGGGTTEVTTVTTDMTTGTEETVTTGQSFDDCQECVEASSLDGRCSEQAALCLQTEGCQELADCVSQCGGATKCVESCSLNASDEAVIAYGDLLACSVCGVCARSCPEYQESCA